MSNPELITEQILTKTGKLVGLRKYVVKDKVKILIFESENDNGGISSRYIHQYDFERGIHYWTHYHNTQICHQYQTDYKGNKIGEEKFWFLNEAKEYWNKPPQLSSEFHGPRHHYIEWDREGKVIANYETN